MDPNGYIRRLLIEAGAVAYGITPAEPVSEEEWLRFEKWISCGYHAGMKYMENYPEIRRDPRLLLEGAVTIISLAYNYRQPNPQSKRIATYALGQDYHKVIRKRLKRVVSQMKECFGGAWRICIDSAPILERYWAQKTGMGTRSDRHGNIIIPGVGSMVFLAELVTTLELKPQHAVLVETSLSKDSPGNKVSECRKRGCPTGALLDSGVVDARKCINYLTIEHGGPLSEGEKSLVGDAFFGCDRCLRVAEENKRETLVGVIDEFRPLTGLWEFINGEKGDFDLKRSPIARKNFFL